MWRYCSRNLCEPKAGWGDGWKRGGGYWRNARKGKENGRKYGKTLGRSWELIQIGGEKVLNFQIRIRIQTKTKKKMRACM
jgi:hypothetical protein